MSVAEVTPEQQNILHFFNFLFEGQKGFMCVSTASPDRSNFKDNFFEWPDRQLEIVKFVDSQSTSRNVWFCVNLLNQPKRRKENCLPSTFVWADLDLVVPTHNGDQPDDVPYPTMVIESSEARFQAYWKIEGAAVNPEIAEEFSRKVAYSMGADKSGWDLTQLLRVPFTKNYKYVPPAKVRVHDIEDIAYDYTIFDQIVIPVSDSEQISSEPLPDDLPVLEEVLYKFQTSAAWNDFLTIYSITPVEGADWSAILWRAIHDCFRMGMSAEETLVVCDSAACNKYKRDNRPLSHLWHDVRKVAQEYETMEIYRYDKVVHLEMPHLVDFDEFEEDTFIKDYKAWATQATDAPEQYHELSCFITLSAILSSGLYFRPSHSYQGITPNIWGLVLGESTLTRKTTAMRLATNMLDAIDPELVVASDGSIEGLLRALSHRPQRTSMFVRDEVSGFFDQLKKKDYLSGMRETLTQLYDVPQVLRRPLSKEVITVHEPYFMFFGGGIRDRVYAAIDEDWILGGFMPRFLIVSGETDIDKLRRVGPATTLSTERRDNLISHLANMRDRFTVSVEQKIAGQVIHKPVRVEGKLTDEAWNFLGDVEEKLIRTAYESEISDLASPTFARLYGHIEKLGLLIAGSRKEPNSDNELSVELSDLKQAAFYVEQWGPNTIHMLLNAGKTESERQVDRALAWVARHPGCRKSDLLNFMKIKATPGKELISTLLDRHMIYTKQAPGGGLYLYPTGSGAT